MHCYTRPNFSELKSSSRANIINSQVVKKYRWRRCETSRIVPSILHSHTIWSKSPW